MLDPTPGSKFHFLAQLSRIKSPRTNWGVILRWNRGIRMGFLQKLKNLVNLVNGNLG